jgi:predicted O-methyltransferase YrrM
MKGVHFADDNGGASLEPAAVHFLKTHAVGRCLELGTGSGKGTESLLEGAMEVVSIDHISTYSNSARDKIKAPNVKFITAPVKTNGFYDLSVVEGRFDLIIIDGPPGTKARRYSVEECLPFLAYGGCILADDANRDIEGIKDAVQKFNLKLEMLPTRRGLAKITRQAAS